MADRTIFLARSHQKEVFYGQQVLVHRSCLVFFTGISPHSTKDAMPMDLPSLTVASINAQFTRACQLHSQGRYQQALDLYHDLVAQVPPSSLLHYNLGLVYYELQRFTVV